MPMFCAVFNCSNRSNREKDKNYYRIPSISKKKDIELQKLTKTRREKWVEALCRKDVSKNDKKLDNMRICSDHFVTGIYSNLLL